MRNGATNSIVQNYYVLRNLEAGRAHFHALLGIGPFVGSAEMVLSDHHYRGQPAEPIRLRGIFARSGDLDIELVEILSNCPDAFHDMFGAGGEGMHHTAMFSDDYAAEKDRWTAAGYPVTSEFATDFGLQICYIDARSQLGHCIELYPDNPIIRGIYARATEAARYWDGQRLTYPGAKPPLPFHPVEKALVEGMISPG